MKLSLRDKSIYNDIVKILVVSHFMMTKCLNKNVNFVSIYVKENKKIQFLNNVDIIHLLFVEVFDSVSK